MADNFVLLVEGKDDEHVLYALLNHHGIPRIYRIKDKQGVENLLNTLEVELLASDLKSLGIIVDADTDIGRRWQSLSQIIRNAGYANVPIAPDTDGTIITEDNKPTVGIWVMPDNIIPGMLENFISFLVPGNNPLWTRVTRCLDEIPEDERLFPPQHLIKAQVHTWLSWQNEPGSPLGLAITRRYLEAETPHAQMLVTWVRRLFNVDV